MSVAQAKRAVAGLWGGGKRMGCTWGETAEGGLSAPYRELQLYLAASYAGIGGKFWVRLRIIRINKKAAQMNVRLFYYL